MRPFSLRNIIGSVLFLHVLLLVACTSSRPGIFGSKTAHEKYADGLSSAGLEKTQLGAQWLKAADRSLLQPLQVTIPYQETGYFAADKPDAAGYNFTAKRGEQVIVNVATTPPSQVLVFVDLWQPGATPDERKLLMSADTNTRRLEYEIEKDGTYQLRLQPELLKGVEYTLSITTGPSLAFPVRKSDNPRVTSLWGANRDGGARLHEGVDIFAKRGTPLIASADGSITRVGDNNLGGKVVFLRPRGKNYNLYYAHLDSQLVSAGQQVKAGDPVGLMGNTGNARTTAPHLHFGIYASGGAVDPFPFINDNRPALKPVKAEIKNLTAFMRSTATAVVYSEPNTKATKVDSKPKGNMFFVLAATDQFYKVRTADDQEGFVSSSLLTKLPLQKQTLQSDKKVRDHFEENAATISLLASGTSVEVLGVHEKFQYIKYEDTVGWISGDK